MTKNQKIAAGCGALGCLGLIVVVVGGGLTYYFMQRSPSRLYTLNSNSNSNSNLNTNSSRNANQSSEEPPSAPPSNSSNQGSSTYSDDEKHKLFQAAGITQDQELIVKVVKKIGMFKEDNTPADEYPQFIKDHMSWAASNTDFIASVNTPEKARAYVDAHLKE
jgi:hypothetical protein